MAFVLSSLAFFFFFLLCRSNDRFQSLHLGRWQDIRFFDFGTKVQRWFNGLSHIAWIFREMLVVPTKCLAMPDERALSAQQHSIANCSNVQLIRFHLSPQFRALLSTSQTFRCMSHSYAISSANQDNGKLMSSCHRKLCNLRNYQRVGRDACVFCFVCGVRNLPLAGRMVPVNWHKWHWQSQPDRW